MFYLPHPQLFLRTASPPGVRQPVEPGGPFDITAWIEAGDWTRNPDDLAGLLRDRAIAPAAADELRRRWKSILKWGKRLGALDPQRRHKLRIQAKKLRYAAEFFAGAFPCKKSARRREAFVAALEQLQDALGDLNDIAVHEEISKRLLESAAADGKRRGGRAKKAFAAGRLSGREESPNGPAAADEMMLACRRGAGQRAAGIVMPREISSRDARRTRQHDG